MSPYDPKTVALVFSTFMFTVTAFAYALMFRFVLSRVSRWWGGPAVLLAALSLISIAVAGDCLRGLPQAFGLTGGSPPLLVAGAGMSLFMVSLVLFMCERNVQALARHMNETSPSDATGTSGSVGAVIASAIGWSVWGAAIWTLTVSAGCFTWFVCEVFRFEPLGF